MGILRPLLGFALVLAIPAMVLSDQNKPNVPSKGAKKGQHHMVRGIVAEVRRDKDADNGSITIRVHHKKQGKATARSQGDLKKFQILPVTKFAYGYGDKDKQASFKDVHEGSRVAVYPMDDRPKIARLVVIHEGKKKQTK